MSKLGIICHDAGGAEIISHWVKYQKKNPLIFVQGPAKKIFNRVLNIRTKNKLDDLIQNSDTLILGTSWQSELEKRAFLLAKKNNISKIIVVLDHWIDYKKRLIYKNNFLKPDQIWVVDSFAYSIAKKEFPDIEIIHIKNFYLEDIKNKYKRYKVNESINNNILFIGDNSSEYQNSKIINEKWNYNEIISLEFFLKNIKSLEIEKPILTIRPHPSEESFKYLGIINKYKDINIKLSNNDALIDDLLISSIVIGTDSMALFIASYLGMKVISIIPKEGKKMTIPSENIIRLVDLII